MISVIDLFASLIIVIIVAPAISKLHEIAAEDDSRALVAGIVILTGAQTWVLLRLWRLI